MRSEEALARTLVYLSGPIAVIVSSSVSIALLIALPAGAGPVYGLFQYGGELVGVGLIGGVAPLAASGAFTALGLRMAGKEGGPRPFRGMSYWLPALLIALLATAVFSLSHELYGGLALPPAWGNAAVLVGSAGGLLHWMARGRRMYAADAFAECYSMGVEGMFLSDVVRTLTGLASAPGSAVFWGGGGFHDLVFWFGIYMALGLSALRMVLPRLSRIADDAATARPVPQPKGHP